MWWAAKRTLSLVLLALGVLRRSFVVVLLVGLIALNIASLTIPAVAQAMSAAITAVTKAPTVYSKLSQKAIASNKLLLKATGEMSSATGKLTKKEAALAKVTAEAVVLRGQLNSANGKLGKMQTKVSSVTKRVRERVARDASRNLGSIYGEALPYVGVGVIVGVTVWELSDACGTMNDMVTLEKETLGREDSSEDAQKVCGYKVPTRAEVWAAIKSSPQMVWESLPELPDLPALTEVSFPEVDWSWRPWN
ncbi:MAG: hypothetical protein DI533_03350 [Cereibacter sphaeroides]|uniref:Uncharacterized protein n=1 Tax=Cereibacter sphaeroides TaxID=1063 RepID=A0A2W5SIX0_CERSP|nr:MAG: hypothetical protein DI533_03350 [Cereibacter sphaeroides]